MKLRMPPDLVVRASGVWNSRAPFHDYLEGFKRLNRVSSLSVLSAERVKRDMRALKPQQSLRNYFAAKKGAGREGTAWTYYCQALGNQRDKATENDIYLDLEGLKTTMRQASLLGQVSLFEMYLQCWTLNCLLAKLESGTLWTNEERYLASTLSPIHGSGTRPGLAAVMRCLPDLRAGLRALPPYFKEPDTKGGGDAKATDHVNALAHVQLWIDLRNLIVHSGGLISKAFCSRHESYWNTCYATLPYVSKLAPSRIKIHHRLLNQAALGFYRAALWMSNYLESLSNQRRGHPFAPGPKPSTSHWDHIPDRSPELLLLGDHPPSYSFASDDGFRAQFIKEYSYE